MYCKICDKESETEICEQCDSIIGNKSILILPYDAYDEQRDYFLDRYSGYIESLKLYNTEGGKRAVTRGFIDSLKRMSMIRFIDGINNADLNRLCEYFRIEFYSGKTIDLSLQFNKGGIHLTWDIS